MIPTFKIEINNENDDQVETNKAELSEYLFGKLRPISESRRSGLYAMFGSQREITEFGLFIYKSGDGMNRCRLRGSVSYTSEWDFEDITEQDSVQMYVYLSAEKFDQLMNFVKFPRPTGAEIRLTGVSRHSA
ncbi:hypothetical protein LMTR13_19865 [Bradyrhizobium icense]|uniref:Uncharacterized protein n=1 Tax=Bradyrhizobium icense TaxID=1274631 RepID=A0A1B1UH80_9BRAD|nr:hypothetical protein LMTR13_19865 [Bradyrhizobium icense]